MKVSFKRAAKDIKSADVFIVTLNPKRAKAIKDSGRLTTDTFGEFFKSSGYASGKGLLPQEFEGKFGQLSVKEILGGKAGARTVGILGVDKEPESNFERLARYRKIGNMLVSLGDKRGAKKLALISEDLDWSDANDIDAFYEGVALSRYSYERYKSNAKKRKYSLTEITIVSKKVGKAASYKVHEAFSLATFLARDLVNTPPIDCPPAELVKTAKTIARKQRLGIDVYNRSALKRMGAGGILGVSMASANEPYLIRLKYKGKSSKAPKIALIGKGITFDSGGLSIKTGQGMETMKCDMSGAAAVLGAMSAIKEVSPKSSVTAYVPTCENMIAANALRPGDIIKHMNGKTVEVLNTDAEGRLILADAMSLAVKDGADIIIDLATLTGACVVALGNDYAGIFSTDKKLSEDIITAGEQVGERYWPLPLAQEYVSQLKSPVADLKNIGSRSGGGAITAALFLQQFIGETKKWAHLDIAGPAFRESESDHLKAGGVGFGVRTLLRFLMNH